MKLLLMRRFIILLIYFFSAFLLGCLIAYPIHLIIDANFERIVSRCVLICALLLFSPSYKALNIKNIAALGFNQAIAPTNTLRPWLLGFIMLLPISASFVFCGYRIWESITSNFLSLMLTILAAIATGLLVGLIEETLFRGFLQSQFNQLTNRLLSILIVSSLYSSVHFLQLPDNYSTDTIY